MEPSAFLTSHFTRWYATVHSACFGPPKTSTSGVRKMTLQRRQQQQRRRRDGEEAVVGDVRLQPSSGLNVVSGDATFHLTTFYLTTFYEMTYYLTVFFLTLFQQGSIF